MNFPRALLVAEIGINHNGDIALAEQIIHAAAEAGADAVKFQNYRTEDFLSDHTLTYSYTSRGREITEAQFDMFKRCELSFADLVRLRTCCDSVGVQFFSSPTSEEGINALRSIGTAWLKNGSDYLGHLPLIRHMAQTGIPTILSTGMATEEEVAKAVAAFRNAGGQDLVLLACTSAYPAPMDSINLRRVNTLAQKFGCPAGFSDHTAGWEAAVAAVCLGACMVEKHFTIDRQLPGPDQSFSSNPAEFSELVRRVRIAEQMLGNGEIEPTRAEQRSREQFRLSCVSTRDLPAGTVLANSDIAFRRPAIGLPPSEVDRLVGRVLRRHVSRGEPLKDSHICEL